MTEIKKLENKLLEFNKNSDYLVAENSQEKKFFTIYSEELKKPLREIIHSKASEEWQIKHIIGGKFIEYRIEQGGKFGLYRKNLTANSPDEFVIVAEGQESLEREEFANANQACEESRRKTEISRKQIEAIRQKDNRGQNLESNLLGENYISITFQKNEEGGRLITKEEHYNDLNQAQKIREGWGYNFTKEMLLEWAQKQKNKGSKLIIQKVIENNADNKEDEQIKEQSSPNSDKDQKSEKETNQQSSLQNNKTNNKNIYYGIGLISLVLLLISMAIVRMKKKR